MLNRTVTVCSVVPASVTVKFAPTPSRVLVSPIESDGGAFLSTIVPTPSSSRRPAKLGVLSVTLRVSFGSLTASPATAISIVFVTSPLAKVS